jgi:hypothetical protein
LHLLEYTAQMPFQAIFTSPFANIERSVFSKGRSTKFIRPFQTTLDLQEVDDAPHYKYGLLSEAAYLRVINLPNPQRCAAPNARPVRAASTLLCG